VREQLERWPNAQVVWAQEEAMNYGAWSYVRPRLENTMRSLAGPGAPSAEPECPLAPDGPTRAPGVVYVGRNPSAAPATGLAAIHQRESDELLEAAFAK
jgi:2-oxoglutarate dehydrogenase E1 component